MLLSNVNVRAFCHSLDGICIILDKRLNKRGIRTIATSIFHPFRFSYTEYNLIPVWVMHADNSKRETMVTVLINATDGSYVDVFY